MKVLPQNTGTDSKQKSVRILFDDKDVIKALSAFAKSEGIEMPECHLETVWHEEDGKLTSGWKMTNSACHVEWETDFDGKLTMVLVVPDNG